jgi:hypothetical protein
MTTWCSLEPVAFIMRWHDDDASPVPYYASATVTVDEAGCARIAGLTAHRFTRASRLAADAAMRGMGWTSLKYSRKGRDGVKRLVRRELAK